MILNFDTEKSLAEMSVNPINLWSKEYTETFIFDVRIWLWINSGNFLENDFWTPSLPLPSILYIWGGRGGGPKIAL